MKILSIAAMLAGLALSMPAPAQVAWTQCAVEQGTCTLATQRLVRYGEPFNNRWTTPRTIVGTFACSNAYFGSDPSPGTGKRCETQDAAVSLPAPAPLPPLPAGTSRYEVAWDAATTNTDGTPIGVILSTAIQVSDTAGFARSLQWLNTGAGTSYIVSQAPNIPVLFWRANHTTAGGTSTWSTPAVRSERQLIEASKPPCWPRPIGAGTWAKGEQNATGWALYWQCTSTAGVASHTGTYGLWSLMDADWVKQLSAALAAGAPAFDTLWSTRASGPMDASAYAGVRPLWEALRAANPLPVPPSQLWKVATNGVFTSRPAFAIVAGARAPTVAGRVGVGMLCDCAAFRSGVAPNTYCAVTGQPNLATAAIDVLPATAAICAR